jgi:hypothetical protein
MYSGSRKKKDGISPPSDDPNATKPATPSRIRQWFTAFNNKFWSIFHRRPTSTELGKGAENGLKTPTESTVRKAVEDISPKNLETIVPLHNEDDFVKVLTLDRKEKEKLIKELLDEKKYPLRKSYEKTTVPTCLYSISQLTQQRNLASLSDEHLNYVLMDLLLLQKKKVGPEHERIQFVQFLRAPFRHPKVMIDTSDDNKAIFFFTSLTGNYLDEDEDVSLYKFNVLSLDHFKIDFKPERYEREHFIALDEDAKKFLDKTYKQQKQTNTSQQEQTPHALVSFNPTHSKAKATCAKLSLLESIQSSNCNSVTFDEVRGASLTQKQDIFRQLFQETFASEYQNDPMLGVLAHMREEDITTFSDENLTYLLFHLLILLKFRSLYLSMKKKKAFIDEVHTLLKTPKQIAEVVFIEGYLTSMTLSGAPFKMISDNENSHYFGITPQHREDFSQNPHLITSDSYLPINETTLHTMIQINPQFLVSDLNDQHTSKRAVPVAAATSL